jgi:hypothetical protein
MIHNFALQSVIAWIKQDRKTFIKQRDDLFLNGKILLKAITFNLSATSELRWTFTPTRASAANFNEFY